MSGIAGTNLDVLIRNSRKIDPLFTLHILSQVASALDYANNRNLYHHFLMPRSIVVDEEFQATLLGFSKKEDGRNSLTSQSTTSLPYTAPEVLRGGELTAESNQFSLAVITYELFFLSRPFKGENYAEVKESITAKDPKFSKNSKLEGVLSKALSKKAEDRFPSCLDFIQQLGEEFQVLVDGGGLVGGYKPGMKLGYKPQVPIDNKERRVEDLTGLNSNKQKRGLPVKLLTFLIFALLAYLFRAEFTESLHNIYQKLDRLVIDISSQDVADEQEDEVTSSLPEELPLTTTSILSEIDTFDFNIDVFSQDLSTRERVGKIREIISELEKGNIVEDWALRVFERLLEDEKNIIRGWAVIGLAKTNLIEAKKIIEEHQKIEKDEKIRSVIGKQLEKLGNG